MHDYFAYGSNMHPDRIRERCPSARLVGAAKLENYRLAFTRESVQTYPGSGVADLIPAPTLTAWGAVYRISNEDFDALDRREGAGRAYERKPVAVKPQNKPTLQATAYTVMEQARRPIPPEVPPSALYLQHLIAGAQKCKLPAEYVGFLESLRSHEPDEFRHGLVVHPTETRAEARGRPLVKVPKAYAAERQLRGEVAVVHRGKAALAQLSASEELRDGTAQLDQRLRHALGMPGRECFGAHVTIRPVIGTP